MTAEELAAQVIREQGGIVLISILTLHSALQVKKVRTLLDAVPVLLQKLLSVVQAAARCMAGTVLMRKV